MLPKDKILYVSSDTLDKLTHHLNLQQSDFFFNSSQNYINHMVSEVFPFFCLIFTIHGHGLNHFPSVYDMSLWASRRRILWIKKISQQWYFHCHKFCFKIGKHITDNVATTIEQWLLNYPLFEHWVGMADLLTAIQTMLINPSLPYRHRSIVWIPLRIPVVLKLCQLMCHRRQSQQNTAKNNSDRRFRSMNL